EGVDPGFDAGRVLTMQISIPAAKGDGPRLAAFFQELADKVGGLPGVRSVAFSNGLPFASANQVPVEIEGRPPAAGRARPLAALYVASADYAPAMGIEVRRGRGFTAADARDAPRVALVDEVLAQRLFPGEPALGKRIRVAIPAQASEPAPEIV